MDTSSRYRPKRFSISSILDEKMVGGGVIFWPLFHVAFLTVKGRGLKGFLLTLSRSLVADTASTF